MHAAPVPAGLTLEAHGMIHIRHDGTREKAVEAMRELVGKPGAVVVMFETSQQAVDFCLHASQFSAYVKEHPNRESGWNTEYAKGLALVASVFLDKAQMFATYQEPSHV